MFPLNPSNSKSFVKFVEQETNNTTINSDNILLIILYFFVKIYKTAH